MLTIHETSPDGMTQVWEMTAGECPRCGKECAVDRPKTPETPQRVLCWFCSYAEGYASWLARTG